MASEKSKGIVTSLVIHGLLGGALILFSGITSTQQPEQNQGTMLIELAGDGDGAPGLAGKKPGLADGTMQGDPKKAPIFDPNKEFEEMTKNLEKIRREQQREAERQARLEAERKAAAEKKAREDAARNKKPPVTQNTAAPAEKVSLDDFLKGQKNQKPPKPVSNSTPPSPVRRQGGAPSIKGASVDSGVKNFGVRGGDGENGGDGGRLSSSAAQNYYDRLATLITANWRALLQSEGSALHSSVSGRFRLTISAGGNLSFNGWIEDPQNPLFERLLRRAIDQVGNCGSRPAGMPNSLNFSVSAKEAH